MSLISSESDKLELIKLSYELVSDPNNFGLLYDVFTNTDNRIAFNDYLTLKGGVAVNTGVKAQMSDYSYNQLIKSVQGKWSQALKADAVRDAFINTNNYFNTDQIRQLISLINSEPNRLELAKLSYKTVTDPANLISLNDLFNSQTSKDELADYVKTLQP